MDANRQSSGRNLIRAVVGTHVGDAIFDVAEVILDQNLGDGLLKDLPLVGIPVKLARTRQVISEELFIRKLVRFLTNLVDIPGEDRAKLQEDYPDGSEKQRVLGENLLLALERLDDIDKPAVLARFFAAYMRSKIDYITFTRLARALERFNMELLPNLRWYYTRVEPVVDTPEEMIHELSLAGLVTAGLAGSGAFGGAAGYRYSSLGKSFLSIGFGVHF